MQIDEKFLLKYNASGPRYTSYPPANLFHTDFSVKDHIKSVKRSNDQTPKNISLYIHIPFCPQRCHFCGCNNVIGVNKSVTEEYINTLIQEIKNTSALLDKNRKVTQIHWGGGTPNSISMKYIQKIMDVISNEFTIAENIEIAIECSPAYLNLNHVDELARIGFNRISLGIQDFRQDVLDIVNRKSSKHPINELINKIRSTSIESINLDFIYGLPLQTPDSFIKTINEAIELKPDRLVTFSYAHVPWVKEYQKTLEDKGLPSPSDKIKMLITSMQQMLDAGYISIGMDHYALPDDELSQALTNKKLSRNFQGYCTKETTGQVYAFGSSGITQLQGAYSQTTKSVDNYIKRINSESFAIERGYSLSKNEQVIRSVINEVMCNGYLNFDDIADEYKITNSDLKKILNFDEEKFQKFINDDLIELTKNTIQVNAKGRLIVRNIAMALDPSLQQGNAVYSKTI